MGVIPADVGANDVVGSELVVMVARGRVAAPRRQPLRGSITTASGLIFAGRFNGQLTAMNSDTGQRLWSFQTDGGFTTTATTFELEGVLYLAGIAGGGVTGGRLNDGPVAVLSPNGTIESLPPGSGDPPPDDGDGNDETK
jgi:outer membrane protein assembly factor BamB